MKKLKLLFFLFLLAIVALAAFSFLLPGTDRVERSVTINANSMAAYPWINELKNWPKWTAWTTNADPTLVIGFTGGESGPGAIYTWTGQKVGNGRLAVTRAEPDKGVRYTLEFDQGKHLSQGGVLLDSSGNTTRVTWFNGGQLGLNPINRYFGLAMDRLMGPDFERGLENLKRIVEAK